MPQGLQVWDENGDLTVDITTRLGILLGFIDTNRQNGSLFVQGFSRGTPFFFANMTEPPSTASAISPRVYTDSSTLYWVYDGEANIARVAARIFYGVY